MILDQYTGTLTPQQQVEVLDYHRHGLSGRKIATTMNISYGKVRGFLEWVLEDSGGGKTLGLDEPRSLATLELLPPPTAGPATLIYDIETTPTLAWMWRAYNENAVAVHQYWYMLGFAWKWLGLKGTNFVSIFQNPEFQPSTPNDLWVAERLHALFDHADIVVAHNGDRFDQKKANERFLVNGFGPTTPYQSIDTLRENKRYFGNFKHTLDELGREYELGHKEDTIGIELWLRCMEGDPVAWATMEKYNRQDVVLLEDIYLKILPWIGTPGKRAHPNHGHWNKGELTCPKCGSTDVIRRGYYRTHVSEFPTIQCKQCGGYSRLRERKTQRDGLHVFAV